LWLISLNRHAFALALATIGLSYVASEVDEYSTVFPKDFAWGAGMVPPSLSLSLSLSPLSAACMHRRGRRKQATKIK